MTNSTKIDNIFRVACFLSTGMLVVKCIVTYLSNEDVTRVEFRKFHEMDDSVYPSTTFCYKHPLKFVGSNVCKSVLTGMKASGIPLPTGVITGPFQWTSWNSFISGVCSNPDMYDWQRFMQGILNCGWPWNINLQVLKLIED